MAEILEGARDVRSPNEPIGRIRAPSTWDPLSAGRPFHSCELTGQDQAISEINAWRAARRAVHENQVNGAGPRPTLRALLLCGVAGLGKTTLARITACAFLCEAAGEPRPCGSCQVCRNFRRSPPRPMSDYIEINAAERSGVAAMSDLSSLMRTAALGYRVAFIDEAHALTTAGTDALLKETEEPSFQSVFILATTREARIAETLRSRCRIVRLREPRQSDRLRFLVSRCEAQGFDPAACEEAALARIAHQAGRSYRALADEFERVLSVVGDGALTAAAVRQAGPLQDFDYCLRCIEYLLDGDVAAAIAVSREWAAEPAAQAEAMQSFLLELSLVEVRGVPVGDSAMAILIPEQRRALVERLEAWRSSSGAAVPLATFIEDCARLLGGS